ncbi:MAG: cob(I)yrinic acid a,c-diamide adenosyltransferase [Bacteroidia bacterium]|nr:cob(I)yrinic acid a,c-diamide adenosyltransferase [Bacteroidia bacterium]
MTIYTKTGDKGLSGLIGGTRVSKNDIRLEAYGTIDELNSFLGLLLAENLDSLDDAFNRNIQHRLFKIGSYLATDQKTTTLIFAEPITKETLSEIEAEIDRIVSGLPELNRFIIPGGNRKAGLCHVCRTICRRAERCTVTVSEHFQVHPNIITYLNRLSDYFFVLGRKCCLSDSSEFFWDNTK